MKLSTGDKLRVLAITIFLACGSAHAQISIDPVDARLGPSLLKLRELTGEATPSPAQMDTLRWLVLTNEFNHLQSKQFFIGHLNAAELAQKDKLVGAIASLVTSAVQDFDAGDLPALSLARNRQLADALAETSKVSNIQLTENLNTQDRFLAFQAFLSAEHGMITEDDLKAMYQFKNALTDHYYQIVKLSLEKALARHQEIESSWLPRFPWFGKWFLRNKFESAAPYLQPEVREEFGRILHLAQDSAEPLNSMTERMALNLVFSATLTCDRLLARTPVRGRLYPD